MSISVYKYGTESSRTSHVPLLHLNYLRDYFLRSDVQSPQVLYWIFSETSNCAPSHPILFFIICFFVALLFHLSSMILSWHMALSLPSPLSPHSNLVRSGRDKMISKSHPERFYFFKFKKCILLLVAQASINHKI